MVSVATYLDSMLSCIFSPSPSDQRFLFFVSVCCEAHQYTSKKKKISPDAVRIGGSQFLKRRVLVLAAHVVVAVVEEPVCCHQQAVVAEMT